MSSLLCRRDDNRTGSGGRESTWKKVPSKAKEILVDQAVSGQDVFINADGQQGTYFIVRIEGKSLSVSDQDKEKIQEQFMMTETGPETMPEKTVFNKGETSVNGSDPVADKWISHNTPPFLDTVSQDRPERYRVLLYKILLST